MKLLEEARAAGLLSVRGSRKVYYTRPIFVGRTPDKSRVYVEIGFQLITRPIETIHHETVSEGWQLAIVGEVFRYRARNASGDGQILDDLRAVEPRTPEIAGLIDAWERFHLNNMRPGCAHHPINARELWETQDVVCPETGYRYGSKWLYEPLPDSAVQSVLNFIRSAQ